ncbi:MAG: alpha/beta fold hydrolase [Brevundimonas sp.]|uniref:S9 family peptidase n=1 Tax=Brevundimonas sp. TaxID=1871086 RepID=UPI002736563B|nr:alpha/beta fold hydrolase [Brevundimonas sp.]MDP3403580.1 alpha/beta fold hydrolase [Brevundimonas sp.]
MRLACPLTLAVALTLAAAPGAYAQTSAPERREAGTLIYSGIPEIPVELKSDLQRYRNARSAGFQDWMADGSMLITTRFGETAQLHRVAAPGADRTQITFFAEPVSNATTIPGTDRFAYQRDAGGAENFQTFVAGLTGGAIAITEPGTRNGGPVFSDDGRLAVWTRVERGQSDYDILAMTVGDLATRRVVFEGTGQFSPLDVSPDGTKVLLSQYISVLDVRLWLLDLASGRATRIRESATPVAYSGGEFTRDGRSIITTSDEGGEALRLVQIALDDGGLTPLTEASIWDVDNFDLSDDGRLLAWSTNEDGYSKVAVRDFVTRRALPQPDLPAGVLGALQFSPDGSRLAIGLSTPSSSGDVWSWDVTGGELTRWTRSEVGPLDPATFVTPELVRYPSFDALQIPAFVYRPTTGEGRRPVIIDIHGGPEGQARPGFSANYQQWVADLGAVVIVPNVRGSSGYGKTWLAADNGPLRQQSVQDIGALLDWIATQADLDPERVVVHGGSYGGFMVLASLAAYSDRLAGAVNIFGIANFVTFLQNTEAYRRDLRRAEYGDERDPAMRAVFDRISPIHLTDRMTAPLLVIQGANDPRVPQSESEQIVDAVRAEGRPVWYLLATNEGHGFRKKFNSDGQAEVTNLFFRQVLGVTPTAAGAQ